MNVTDMPDPGPIMQAMTGFWVSGALKGAVDLDLFTHVSAGKTTVSELARATSSTERGISAIANAMVTLGFLTKSNNRYANTPTADVFMCSDKPTYFSGFANFIAAKPFVDAFSKVAEAAQSGKSVFDKSAESPDNPLWVTFAETSLAMAVGGAMPLRDIIDAQRPGLRILDVAAGSGGYGITLAQASKGSSLTILDWPSVAAVAKRHADMMGVKDAKVIAGSAFDADWGGPYDVIVMGNFFHHFDFPTCVQVAKKARAALADGGVFATAEFVADESRSQPGSMALIFAVAMLVWSNAGNSYTQDELARILKEAGFAETSHHLMGDNPSSWVVAR